MVMAASGSLVITVLSLSNSGNYIKELLWRVAAVCITA